MTSLASVLLPLPDLPTIKIRKVYLPAMTHPQAVDRLFRSQNGDPGIPLQSQQVRFITGHQPISLSGNRRAKDQKIVIVLKRESGLYRFYEVRVGLQPVDQCPGDVLWYVLF